MSPMLQPGAFGSFNDGATDRGPEDAHPHTGHSADWPPGGIQGSIDLPTDTERPRPAQTRGVETQRRQQVLKLGLRTKFFLYSNTVIVVTMSLVAIVADVHDRRQAYEAMQSRGERTTEALGILLTDTLARAEPRPEEAARYAARIDRHIQGILAGNRGIVRYIVVTDPEGVVTHSTEAGRVGRSFDRAVLGGAGGAKTVSEIVTPPRGERVLEVRMPLEASGRRLGGLAIGFSLAPVERRLAAIPRRLVVVALLLMLVNSVLTAIYVEALIRPILSLHQDHEARGPRGPHRARAGPTAATRWASWPPPSTA